MTTPIIGSEIGRLREHGDDGNSTFAIAPGVAIASQCNQETNWRLQHRGIEVAALDASELGRGHSRSRGMSQPILRDPLS